MICPTKPAAAISLEFVTADIENRLDGSLISIDTYDGQTGTHYKHYDWEEWLRWVKVQGKLEDNQRFRTVYAHNGGKWDWLSFLEWVIGEKEEKWDAIETNDRIIAIAMPLGGRARLELRDSLYILNCSLDEAGRKYCGRGKVEYSKFPLGIPKGARPHWLWLNDRAAYHKYHEGDTELLYDAIKSFANLVFTRISPIEKLRLTLPATAMQIFCTSYLGDSISTPGDERARILLRCGYVGGRVECFKPGHYKSVNVYDFNSLYPSVMATTPVPTSSRVRWSKKLDAEALEGCGCYEVAFNQTRHDVKPLLMVGGKGVFQGTGVFFTNELRRFVNHNLGTLKVHMGIRFVDTGTVFADYVAKLYALRLEDRDGPLGNTCKLLLNSLYGKFGQKPERSQIRMLTAEEISDMVRGDPATGREPQKVQPISRTNPFLCRVQTVKKARFEHVGIAGTITSEARARLWESFDNGVIYCDTDSIHTTGKLAHDGAKLGALKLEFSGEAVYLGKKLYGLRHKPGTVDKKGKLLGDKLRAKGIRVKKDSEDDIGFALTFEGLLPLLGSGTLLPCHFKSSPTANAVLKGTDSACVFRERTRTIKRTA